MNEKQPVPIACELPEDEQKRCGEMYRSGLFSQVQEVRERSGGYALRFEWSQERVRELGEFLAQDSACCSFLGHAMDVPPGREAIWLHLTGPEEARQVLQKEVELLLPRHVRLPTGGSVARGSGTRWGALGVSGLGLAAVLCCAVPTLGLAVAVAAATAGAWLVDSALTTGLLSGFAILAWAYSRRAAKRADSCCN